jgi:hypothetical protein
VINFGCPIAHHAFAVGADVPIIENFFFDFKREQLRPFSPLALCETILRECIFGGDSCWWRRHTLI